MLKVKTKELKISNELKRKVDMICKFAHVKPKYQNGNIICIDKTNIAYVKPHIITILETDFLIFDKSNDIFVNGYQERIKFKDLESYLKDIVKRKNSKTS